jgi:hypothetical protein
VCGLWFDLEVLTVGKTARIFSIRILTPNFGSGVPTLPP